MSRNPTLEAIHEARYDLETCHRSNRSACERRLDELLRQALQRAGSKASPEQLLDSIFDDYQEFRRGKRRAAWPRLPERG